MTELVNFNGEITPEAEARVPVLDRGFLFGDSVYEVVRTRKGGFHSVGRHLDRLERSAGRIRMKLPLPRVELLERCAETVQAAGNAESYVRIIVTRGTGTAPNIDLAYAPEEPNLIIMVRPLPLPPADLLEKGFSAEVVSVRRNDPRALDPAIKSGNYLNNIMGLMEARRDGADTAIILNTLGQVTEAPTSNLWLVKNGEALTPPPEVGILEGITRGLLLEFGEEGGADGKLSTREQLLEEKDLREADEIFMTSTLMDIAPITRLDGHPIGTGRPGPVTLELSQGFSAWLDQGGGD